MNSKRLPPFAPLFAMVVTPFLVCLAHGETRSIDGTGNNLNPANVDWGAANTQLIRLAPADYMDGIGDVMIEPPMRANPRVISNAIVSQPGILPNSYGLTNFVWQWGQFVDHDISLTQGDSVNGVAPVPVPPGDILGPMPMPFSRSNYDPMTGTGVGNPRQQVNEITSYLDGSNIYGSDIGRANWLRTMSGGRLKTSANNLLPYNDGTIPNAGPPELPDFSTELFVAGDIRSNEQSGLTAVHTLFVREHNRLAGLLEAQMPGATDSDIYETARRIVGAEIQSITYNEFLPALLGDVTLPAYTGYQDTVNASIATEFSTAFYRFGHTMLLPQFKLVEPGGGPSGTLALRDAFFAPSFYDDPTNVDRILGGLTTLAQEIDTMLVDDVRNFLFGPPGAGGFDLATLNIQRGRDHGLDDYNSLRVAYGLLAKEKFLTDGVLSDGMTPNGVTADPVVAAKLESVYDTVDDIDAWLGGLAEDAWTGSPVSQVVGAALADQFTRLRDGDRFFYRNDPLLDTPEIAAVIDLNAVRLQDIIELNTLVRFNVSNIFVVPEPGSCVLMMLASLGLALRRNRNVT